MSGLLSMLILAVTMLLPATPSGKAVNKAALFQYVPSDSMFVATIDAGSIIGPGLKQLVKLGQEPFIKNVPEVKKGFERMKTMMQRAVDEGSGRIGVDITKAVHYVLVSLSPGKRDPRLLVVVGGKIPRTALDKVARSLRLSSPVIRIGPFYAMIPSTRSRFGVAWHASGVLLFAQRDFLKGILETGAHKTHKKGTLASRMLRLHSRLAAVALGFQPTPKIRTAMARLPIQSLLAGTEAVHLAIEYRGLALTLFSDKKPIRKRWMTILDGVSDLIRSADLVARGALKAADALINPDDPGLPKQLVQLFKFKKPLLAFFKKRIIGLKLSRKLKTSGDTVGLRMAGRGVGGPMLVAMLGFGAFFGMLFF